MKTAKVFKSGNSQAVRIPKEFEIDAREVSIQRKGKDLILSPAKKSWKEYYARGRRFTGDFMESSDDAPAEERKPW